MQSDRWDSMKQSVSRWLTSIEWVLLVVGALMIAISIIPFSDMYDFSRAVREAKKDNIYYDGPKETQTYFNRSLRVEGVIYDGSELTVMVRGCRFGPHEKLPQHAYLKTINGEEIGWSGSGSSSTVFCARGFFNYENVPTEISQVEFTNEAFGESFSFILDLSKEAEQ